MKYFMEHPEYSLYSIAWPISQSTLVTQIVLGKNKRVIYLAWQVINEWEQLVKKNFVYFIIKIH